jgi:hypothetical protein
MNQKGILALESQAGGDAAGSLQDRACVDIRPADLGSADALFQPGLKPSQSRLEHIMVIVAPGIA